MRTWKLIAIVVGAAVVIAVVLAGDWWGRNGPKLLQASRAELQAGRDRGRVATTEQCIDDSIRRLDADSAGILATVRQSFFVKGCVEAAADLRTFCARDTTHGMMARARWYANLCLAKKAKSPYCPQLLQPLAMACDSSRSKG